MNQYVTVTIAGLLLGAAASIAAVITTQERLNRRQIHAWLYGHTGRRPHHNHVGRSTYLSTGCLHAEHAYCQNKTGQAGPKTPAVCKFCEAPCICPCHMTGDTHA